MAKVKARPFRTKHVLLHEQLDSLIEAAVNKEPAQCKEITEQAIETAMKYSRRFPGSQSMIIADTLRTDVMHAIRQADKYLGERSEQMQRVEGIAVTLRSIVAREVKHALDMSARRVHVSPFAREVAKELSTAIERALARCDSAVKRNARLK